MDRYKNKKIVLAALIAALAYLGFAVFRFDINIAGVKTAFHLGNTFVILGALILGGRLGYLAGAVGLTIADLTSGYIMYAPTTFILKFLIAIVCGTVAHKLCKINTQNDKNVIKYTVISTTVAMAFNAVFDPLISFIRAYIMFNFGLLENTAKTPDIAKIIAGMSSITTLVNAITTIIIVTLIYLPILKLLKKQGYTAILNEEEKINE